MCWEWTDPRIWQICKFGQRHWSAYRSDIDFCRWCQDSAPYPSRAATSRSSRATTAGACSIRFRRWGYSRTGWAVGRAHRLALGLRLGRIHVQLAVPVERLNLRFDGQRALRYSTVQAWHCSPPLLAPELAPRGLAMLSKSISHESRGWSMGHRQPRQTRPHSS